ncbi:tight adherence protein B [Nitrosomonas nitrosa]|uniref:Tight adherence protein B n=1 Tax=Nitrosomonas nitrosa TaxID=52442 RepID=A0A1I4UU68_9PROT|nr:type II secretion system F family protein [Nitrosomonas nitrosa]MCW5599142.1 type II secretion system F family protein [Nitrosomonas sp.]PTR04527.1 tight adherence protein B [Nitrosomonas nitrosa]SFM92539.1 tight adherence protein B [Nitrosomonas nitrosa]HNP52006.1 type II secretion system F family protein [Nitrosomonas nitrosa]
MDYLYYFFIVLAFLAVVLLLEGGYLIWNAHLGKKVQRIQKRLQEITISQNEDGNVSLLKQRLLSHSPPLQKLLLSIPRVHILDQLLLQSGQPLLVSRFIGYIFIMGIGAMAVAALFNMSLPVILLSAIVGGSLPFFFIFREKNKRLRAIEQQLPETIDLMSRALKAGHAFPGALQMAATESSEPTASEFRMVFDEVNYGVPIHTALMGLATRVPITDLRYFVIAVLIQRESGGNLAELLDKISSLIRARLTLLGKVRVLSAEGRLSAWILSSLPFAMAVLLNIVNPSFMSILWTDPAGPFIIAVALGMMVVGIFAMSRIIKIRV